MDRPDQGCLGGNAKQKNRRAGVSGPKPVSVLWLDHRSNDDNSPLADALEQIIEEFRAVSPDHAITVLLDISPVIACDRARMAQLLSNLVANALTHGAASRPIGVIARVEGERFFLSVTNEGEAIPADQLPHLFAPLHKGSDRSSRHWLGLGLHIASEIAKAHCGRMTVKSNTGATTFSFEMPFNG